MIRYVPFVLLVAAVAVIPHSGNAQSPNDINPTLPETARSTEEIEHALDSHKGFGNPQSVRLNSHGRYLFVIWNCPYSGIDLNHIWAFYFDGSYWRKFYTGGIHAAPPAVSPKLNEGEDQLVIGGRRPSDRITVPLKTIPAAAAPP
jgi:hypothetical protein